MRIPRLYTPQPLTGGAQCVLQAAASHYLCRVLRARSGQSVRLFNGEEDAEYAAELIQPSESAAVLRVGERQPCRPEGPLHLTLAQSLCRGEKMDLVLQKAVELGVAAIQPLVSERTEVHLDAERSSKRYSHWRGVILGACEQSGRVRVPELLPVLALPEWLSQPADGLRVVLDPQATRSLRDVPLAAHRLCVLIGPEGGFSDRERDIFAAADVQGVRVGPRILRTETAGPAVLAALQALRGDWDDG